MKNGNMTHRDRVMMALNHKEPDRVPKDLGGRISTMMQGAYKNFKKYLNLDECGYDTVNTDWFTVMEYDERVLEYLDIDFRRVFLKNSSEYEKIVKEDGTWIDELGFTRKYSGIYGDMIDHPFHSAENIGDIKKVKFQSASDPSRIEGLKERVEYLYYKTDYAIVAHAKFGGIFQTATWARGYDKFLVDLLVDKKMANAILEKLANYYMELYESFLNVVGPYIQMIEIADDIGIQTGLLISPKTYEEMILPIYKEFLNFIKSKTNAKIWHHSDGSVVDGIKFLLDAGIDILNSLQPKATGMDSTYLKDEYGDQLCFHGGVDIQEVLPYGTVEDVENEVKRRIAIYAPGGGYVLCAAHAIQVDVSPENVIAMYAAGNKYGKYPLSDEILDIRKTIPKK